MRRQKARSHRPAQGVRVLRQRVESVGVHDHRPLEILDHGQHVGRVALAQSRPDGQRVERQVEHGKVAIHGRHHHLGHHRRGHERVDVGRHEERDQPRSGPHRGLGGHDRRPGEAA